MTTNNPLVTTANMLLSLGDISDYIEKKYSTSLKFPPKGIYKYGETTPSIFDNGVYFVKNINDKNKVLQLMDINVLVKGDYVTDINDKLVLTTNDIENKDRFLYNYPTVPTIGFEVAKLCIEMQISRLNIYTNEHSSLRYRLDNCFISQNHFDFEDNPNNNKIFSTDLVISDMYLSSYYDQVESFIGKDTSHIYFYKRKGICDLLIEKTIDWRAYQWELQRINKSQHDNSTI